jgi:PAS domain S-box-containing protein
MALDILKYIPVPAFLARENTLEIIDVNSHAEILMSMNKSQLLSRTMQDFIPDSYLYEYGKLESIPLRTNTTETIGTITVNKAPDTSNILIYTFVKDDSSAEKNIFQDIMSGNSQGIIVINKNLTIVDVNKAMCDMINTPRSELIGKSGLILSQKFLTIENIKRVMPAIKNMMLGKSVSEYEIGFQEKTFAISASINKESKYYVAIIRDITKLRKQQTELKDSEELYRTLFHASKDAILTMHPPKWKFQTFNKSALELFDYDNESDLSGLTPAILSPQYQPDGSLSDHAATLRTEEAIRYGYSFFDWQHRTSKGNVFWATVLLNRVDTAKGSFIQATIRDITAQRELENDLIQAKNKAEESDRLKSAFLANMSHEIRTPMNGILGFTDLLQRDDLSQSQINNFIDIIQKSGKRMLETVNDLIEISQIETGHITIKKETMSITDQMNKLLHIYKNDAKEKDINLVFESKNPEVLYISTDISKFNTIMANLIKNAIKFTNEGKVSFGYRLTNDDYDKQIEFFVDDTGIGIPKDKLNSIFKRFEQIDTQKDRSYEGTGLGLSISKAYAEMLGTKIAIESEVDFGSRFSFRLPFEPLTFS